jgi:hypothetical protein
MTFKEKIDNILTTNTLGINTISGLEQKLGVGVGTILKSYKKSSNPGLGTVKRIIDGLGIHPEWWHKAKGPIYIDQPMVVNHQRTPPESVEVLRKNLEDLRKNLEDLRKNLDDLRKHRDDQDETIKAMEVSDKAQDKLLDEYRRQLEDCEKKLSKIRQAS